MEKQVFSRPEALRDVPTHYCPGCHHGIIHRLVAEVIDELGIREKTIGASSIGCSVLAYDYFNFDVVGCMHGRAPAAATGIKRSHPDKIVFTYQGDGDLAAIGTAEIIHAAARSENISVIFVNNAIYGMTGGQMAPTTLEGQTTTTSPYGRDHLLAGNPIKVAELMAAIDGPVFVQRVSVHTPKHINEAKKAIKKSFELQLAGKGFSLVEVLSTCPTNWGMTPTKASEWVGTTMMQHYPLGVTKDIEQGAAQ